MYDVEHGEREKESIASDFFYDYDYLRHIPADPKWTLVINNIFSFWYAYSRPDHDNHMLQGVQNWAFDAALNNENWSAELI
jgi:hypothetical protein